LRSITYCCMFDIDVRRERLMGRASVGDFHSLGPLFARQGAGKLTLPLDPIDLSYLGFAIGAIGRVNFRVVQRNRYILEWPPLSSRIERDRHRRAGAERGEEKIVRRRPHICSAESDRFIAFETMRTDFNFLGEPSRTAADDYMRRTIRSVGYHWWNNN